MYSCRAHTKGQERSRWAVRVDLLANRRALHPKGHSNQRTCLCRGPKRRKNRAKGHSNQEPTIATFQPRRTLMNICKDLSTGRSGRLTVPQGMADSYVPYREHVTMVTMARIMCWQRNNTQMGSCPRWKVGSRFREETGRYSVYRPRSRTPQSYPERQLPWKP